MNRRSIASLVFALCGLFAFALARAEQPLLANGAAVFSQLQEEYYYASLFVEEASSTTESLQTQRQRMEFTVLVDAWSKRQFLQYWMQAIYINNDEAMQDSADKAVEAFANAIKGELLKGDKFSIVRHADQHASVYLNGTRLMHTSNTDFYPLMLNCWVGNRPPSQEFKQALLGSAMLSPARVASYESLPVSASRKQRIKSWAPVKRKPPPVEVAAAPPETATSESPPPEKIATPTASGENTTVPTQQGDARVQTSAHQKQAPEDLPTAAAQPAEVSASEALPAHTPESAAQAVQAQPIETPDRAISAATNAGVEDDAIETEPAAEADTVAAQPTLSSETEATEATDAAETASTSPSADIESTNPADADSVESTAGTIDSEQSAIEQPANEQATGESALPVEQDSAMSTADYEDYYAALISKTYQQVRYPRSAIRGEHQGKVVLRVRINRSGDIEAVSFEEKSRYRTLNTAANKAVERAAPFSAVPGAIPESELEFIVPIEFKLTES